MEENDYSDDFKKIIEEVNEEERQKKILERENDVAKLKEFNEKNDNNELTKLIIKAIKIDCSFIFNEIAANMDSYQNFLSKNNAVDNNNLLLKTVIDSNEDYFDLFSSLKCFKRKVKTNEFLELACENKNSFIANKCLEVGLYDKKNLKKDITKGGWSTNHVSKLIVKDYMKKKKDLDFITLFEYDYYDVNEIKDLTIYETLKLMQDFQQTKYFSRNNNPTEVFNQRINPAYSQEEDNELMKNKIRFVSNIINNLLNDIQYHNVGIIILNESLVTLGKNDKIFGLGALNILLEVMPDKEDLVMDNLSKMYDSNHWFIETKVKKFKEALENKLVKQHNKENKKLKM